MNCNRHITESPLITLSSMVDLCLLHRAGGGTLSSGDPLIKSPDRRRLQVDVDHVPHVRIRMTASSGIGHPAFSHPALTSSRMRGLGQDSFHIERKDTLFNP